MEWSPSRRRGEPTLLSPALASTDRRSSVHRYRPGDFLAAVAESLPARLPEERRRLEWRQRGGLVQFWYGPPRLHYEVWFHRRVERLEIGLHFEADPATNAHLLERFSEHLILAKAEISELVEAEAWDRGWTRIREMLPIEALDEAFLETVTSRLARMIVVLQPLLEEAVAELSEPLPAGPTPSATHRRWRRRAGRSLG